MDRGDGRVRGAAAGALRTRAIRRRMHVMESADHEVVGRPTEGSAVQKSALHGFVLARTRLKLVRCAGNQILLSSVSLALSEVEVFRRLIE